MFTLAVAEVSKYFGVPRKGFISTWARQLFCNLVLLTLFPYFFKDGVGFGDDLSLMNNHYVRVYKINNS